MAPSVLVQIDRVLENVRVLTKAVETENAKDSDGGYFEAYEALVEQCSTMDAIEVHLRDIGYPDSDPVLVDSIGLRKSPFRYRKPNAIFDTGKLVGGNALEVVRFFRLIEQGLLKARSFCTDAQKPTPNNREDGPVAPDGFRHDGKVYDTPSLARGPFRALSVAWESEGRCANREDLAGTLYGDREEQLNENTLRDLRGTLNDFFRAHDIPYKAIVRGYSIAIKDGKPPAARSAKQSRPSRKKKIRL